MTAFRLVLYALLLPGATFATRCKDERCVRISGISEKEKSFLYREHGAANYFQNLWSTYGNTIDIFCSGDAATHLEISEHGVRQTAEVVNVTTLQLTMYKPEVQYFLYICTDVTTSVEDLLYVKIEPVITVSSENVRQKRFGKALSFFVPITEDYEVSCFGYPSHSLAIYNTERIYTDILNNDTIKSRKMREIEPVKLDYHCDSPRATVSVYVDYPPAAKDFWCVEYEERIRCTWNVKCLYSSFTLFYIDDTGNSARLCEDHSSKSTKLCEWNFLDVQAYGMEVNEDISLIMQSCNLFFCLNETFHINRMTIMRAPASFDLETLNTTSFTVTVTWSDVWRNGLPSNRLKFRQLGKGALESPTVLNGERSWSGPPNPAKSKMEYKLPCPGTLYELKVYSKYRSAPEIEEYWSEPASITLRTTEASEDAVDPACSAEPELITNKDSGVYAVKLLAREYRQGKKGLQEKNNALKKKLAQLEAVSNSETIL